MMGWFVEHNTHAKDNIETLHAIDTKRRARDRNKIQRENREIKRKKVKQRTGKRETENEIESGRERNKIRREKQRDKEKKENQRAGKRERENEIESGREREKQNTERETKR